MTHRLLLVDDEANYRKVLRLMLADLDVVIEEAEDGAVALKKIAAMQECQTPIDLVISDVNMPNLSGLSMLQKLREQEGAPPVVIITAWASVDDAVAALQAGAIDYLTKPFDEKRLKLTLQRALVVTDLLQENHRLHSDVRERYDFSAILGQSTALTAALTTAAKVAAADAPVLLQGESGTGKELFARAIHINSKRGRGPFIAVNCAAIPDTLLEVELFGAEPGAYTGASKRRRGRVELARGGTLFLDEIGDLPLPLQAKLLRLLQEKTFQLLGGEKEEKADVRFICASHRDLGQMVKDGTFREDLHFRVAVLPLLLPPLRERSEDVHLLADTVVARVCASMGRKVLPFTERARTALARHRWPGNIRELSNVVERAVILCDGDVLDDIDLELPTAMPTASLPTTADAPSTSTSSSSFVLPPLPEGGIILEDVERELVRSALDRARGNKSQAARLLGLTRATLRYRLDKYGLDVDEG